MFRPKVDSRVRESASRSLWVPPPGRSSSPDKMASMRTRLTEMEALASLLPADSELHLEQPCRRRDLAAESIANHDRQGVTGRHSGAGTRSLPPGSPLKTRTPDKRAARIRRKPVKLSMSQRPRRSALVEEAHRIRRRPGSVLFRDAAPAASTESATEPSGSEVAEPQWGEGGEAGGGQAVEGLTETIVEQMKPREERSESKPDLLQAVLPKMPDLAELPVPADGSQGTLEDVLQKFMWAKQQASAAANLMSSLREVVEKMNLQEPPSAAPTLPRIPADTVASCPPRYTTTSTTAAAAAAATAHPAPSSAVAASSRPPAGRRVGLPSGGGASNLPNSARHPPRAPLQVAGTSLAAGTSTDFSSAMDQDQRPVPRSTRSAVSVTSSETTSLLPDESRSQLAPSKASTAADVRVMSSETTALLPDESRSQLAPSKASTAADVRDSDAGLRSVSESQLNRGADPAATAHAQQQNVEELRKQFQQQHERLRKMEQTNYVLTLAVNGQEKTIRTLTNQLDDTKAALLQEIQTQMNTAASAGERNVGGRTDRSQSPSSAGHRRSRRSRHGSKGSHHSRRGSPDKRRGTTQTGPSLVSVTADRASAVSRVHAEQRVSRWRQDSALAMGRGAAGQQEGVKSALPPPEDVPAEEEGLTSEGGASPDRRCPTAQKEGAAKSQQRDRELAASVADGFEDQNKRELQRLAAALEAKERELAALRSVQLNTTDTQSAGDHNVAFSTPINETYHPAQLELAASTGLRRRWDGAQVTGTGARGRAHSTEMFRRSLAAATPTRRHSFTAPVNRTAGDDWRLPPAPVRAQRSLLPELERESLHRPATDGGGRHTEFDQQCEDLQRAVEEGRSKIGRLEEEVFELRCTQKQTRDKAQLPAMSCLSACPTNAAGPFPNIVRLTEVKLQEAYQLLLVEKQRSKQLTQQTQTAATKLEQVTASAEQLKQQLASSVEERQALQIRLTEVEATGERQQRKTMELSDELKRKDALLNQTTQHLEERVGQVAALSRELESFRVESAQEEQRAAGRLAEQLDHTRQLEENLTTMERENQRLRLAKDDAEELSRNEKRTRQRCLELQERLDQSTNTARMLENYIHFLKSSYNSMFGTPTPTAPAGLFEEGGAGLASVYSTTSGGSKAYK